MRRRLGSVGGGSLGVAAGLGVLGGAAYLFLLLAGQVLGDDGYAPLGALWIVVFLAVPAFLYPVEQELSCAIAARRASGQGTAPLVRRAAVLAGWLTLALLVATAFLAPVLDDRIFDGNGLLLVALVASLVSYATTYVARGVFAGYGELGSYGVLLAGEGLWRLGGAVVLALVGVRTAGPYGVLIGLCPFLAFAVVAARLPRFLDPGPDASWRELTASLGNLVAAAVVSQVLLNAAPLIVKYAAASDEQALAGAFAKAVMLSRIPLFLFQAVQAVMLPRLTRLATIGERDGFRRAFAQVLLLVGGIGFVGVLAAFAVGEDLLALFGSDTGLPRTDLTLLAAGNAVFLLGMTASQGLIAVRGQAGTVVAWSMGLVAFAVVAVQPGDILRRVEVGLVVGAAMSVALMLAVLARRLQEGRFGAAAPGEALEPTGLIADL